MKSKISKIMGIGLALVLLVSMMVFALPVAAGPYDDLEPAKPNTWDDFQPTPGAAGLWFFDPDIAQVGPIAEAIDGTLFAYVENAGGTDGLPDEATPNNDGANDIFKSVDGGRTWTVSAVP
ncbi:unnamed protein product, partial [marine sediment metagenome]